MISLRQHAISIVAIFLALALGIVLGSTALADSVFSSLTSDKAQLQERLQVVEGEGSALRELAARSDQFDAAIAGRAVRDALAGRAVVVVAAPGAQGADLDAVSGVLAQAGGRVTGRVVLTPDFVDVQAGDRLRSTVTSVIPAGAQLRTGAVDQASLAGDLLGVVLLVDPATRQPAASPQERELVLASLQRGGFLDQAAAPLLPTEPAEAVVVVAGPGEGARDGNTGALVARLAGALAGRGAGVVLAEPGSSAQEGSAQGGGAVAVARSDGALAAAVSTVDAADTPSGRITVALALRERLDGGRGHYGVGQGAAAVTVGG